MGKGKTGGHWKPCNIGSVEAHNERRPEYLESVKKAGLSLYFFENLTKHNDHWGSDSVRYKDKTVAEVFEAMKKLYKEKTGQAPQLQDKIKVNKKTGKEYKYAGWSPIREMCPPIKEDTKIEDFDYFIKWAQKHGIEIIRIDLHKDEGYHDKDTGEYKMNYHAHVVASFLNWETGKTVKPNSQTMSEMQTILAMALDMERGERKANTGKQYLNHVQYKEMMEAIDTEKKKIIEEAKKEASAIVDEARNDANHIKQSTEDELQSLKAEVKKAETRLKGLTTMLTNLEAQKDNLEAQIAALEDEYSENNEQMEQKRSELLAKLAEIEEKISDKTQKFKIAEQKLDGLTRKLASEESKFENLALRNMEVEDQILSLSADAAKDMANKKEKMKEVDKAILEKRTEIAQMDKSGELARAQKHIECRDAVLYRHWPEAQAAVKAIYERANSINAREFTQHQALDVENAINTSGISRSEAADELLSLAQKDFDNNRTWQAWVNDTAQEVLAIAQGIHVLTPFLQQYGHGGGAGGGNNDLPRKKDDDRNTGYQAMKPKGRK